MYIVEDLHQACTTFGPHREAQNLVFLACFFPKKILDDEKKNCACQEN
jgi:hypothetical protein